MFAEKTQDPYSNRYAQRAYLTRRNLDIGMMINDGRLLALHTGRVLALASGTALATGAVAAYRHPFATKRAVSRYRLLLSGVSERTVNLEGLELRYFDAEPAPGHGQLALPAVVLLHGLSDSAETWIRLIPDLARRYRVLAPDLLGSGRTPAPPEGLRFSVLVEYVGRFMDALGLRQVVLVGNSLGGAVAIRYAAQHQSRVARLFLLNSAGLLGAVPGVLEPRTRAMARELVTVVRGSGNVPSFILDDLVRMTRDPLRRAALRSSDPVDVSADLSRVAAPATLVWGERDRLIPVEHGERLRAALGNAELIVLPQAGHLPQADAPRAVLRIMHERLDTPQSWQSKPQQFLPDAGILPH